MTYCSSCGSPIEPGTRYCGSCGAPVTPAPQPTNAALPPSQPDAPRSGARWLVPAVAAVLALALVGWVLLRDKGAEQPSAGPSTVTVAPSSGASSGPSSSATSSTSSTASTTTSPTSSPTPVRAWREDIVGSPAHAAPGTRAVADGSADQCAATGGQVEGYPTARCRAYRPGATSDGEPFGKGPLSVVCQQQRDANPVYKDGQTNTYWVWAVVNSAYQWVPETALAEGSPDRPVGGVALCTEPEIDTD